MIKSNVTSIGISSFAGCINLASINVDNDNPLYSSIDGVLFDKDQMVLMYYPIGKTDKEYIIPDGTIYVYDSAFYIGSSGDFLSNLEFIIVLVILILPVFSEIYLISKLVNLLFAS